MRLAGRLTRLPAIGRPFRSGAPLAVRADAAPPAPTEARRALTLLGIGLARPMVVAPGPVAPGLVAAGPPAARPARLSLRALSFVVLVLIPTAVTAVYYFAIAADQYVAEFRFTLNTVDPPPLGPLSLFAGNAIQSPATLESQVLVQYITSRAIVDQIARSLDVRRLFSPPEADWWARLPRSAAIEEVVHYWRGQVDPFYDPSDGTITVRVRAFSPEDALRLSQAIVVAGENLVNDLSLRARRDALRHAEADLTQAQARLKTVLGKISAFRDREGLIDPAKTAASTGAIATQLRESLIRDRAELTTLRNYMRANAPTVKVLEARIRSLEAQRRSLGHELTGPDTAHSDALSHVLGSYEELQSERQFAEAAYQHALQGLDEARADADRRHVFVASFIPPSLPEESLYPRRWRALGTVALLAFALWGIGGLAAQSIRDHLA